MDLATRVVPNTVSPDTAAQLGPKSGQHYLAFISYRRRDGGAVAAWLRQRIGTFVPPRELTAKVATADERIGGRFNRVFLDLSYQRSHTDFWRDHIAPSVTRSENLLLVLTPSVFQKLPDGEPNWVEQEIETFLAAGNDPARILLVRGPGSIDDRLPDALARLSSRWDWADLRFFSTSAYVRWRRSADYDAQLTKIIARIFDVKDGELPALTREFERARARIHRRIYSAGVATIVGLTGLTGWAVVERVRATRAEAVAVEQRDEALRQRNAALVAQSLFLTETAAVYRKQGSARQAMKLLLPALPDKTHGNDRPLVGETVAETYKVLYGDRELARIALPDGTSAVASTPDGKQLAAVTSTKITFLEMPAGRTARAVENPGGAASRAAFSADGSKLLLVDSDGKTRVVEAAGGSLLTQHAGLRVGTRAQFVDGSRKILLQSNDNNQLILLEVATGNAIARTFDSAMPAYASDDGDTLLIAADKEIRLLATSDLSDSATRPLTEEAYVAFAKVPDGGPILMAAGLDMLKGSIVFLDPLTLAEMRRFRLTLGYVTHISVSPDKRTIAVHTPPNLTFYEADTGFPQSVEATSAISGRFVATGYERYRNYAYASNGIVTVTIPGLNLQTNYKSEDEGELVDFVMDTDGQAFTSVTATPVVTRWSAKDVAVRQTLAVDKKIGETLMRNFPFMNTINSPDLKQLAVAYADTSIGIWNIEQSSLATTLDAPMRKDATPNAMAFSQDSRFIVRGESSGDLSIFDLVTKKLIQTRISEQPVVQIQFPAVRRMLVELQDGSVIAADIEANGVEATMLKTLGQCHGIVVNKTRGQCNTLEGGSIIFDTATGAKLWNEARGSNGAAPALAIFPHSDRFIAIDNHGLLSLHSFEGTVLWDLQLISTLSGELLRGAVDSPLIDQPTREAILRGATEVSVKLPANGVVVSPDETKALISFPNRTIQLVDLENRTARTVLQFDQPIRYAIFSANGKQIAAIASATDVEGRGVFQVYDIELDRVIYGTYALNGKIFALADGRGFALAMPPYNLSVLPIYERYEDLVATVAQKYPERLTPKQRQYFHIE